MDTINDNNNDDDGVRINSFNSGERINSHDSEERINSLDSEELINSLDSGDLLLFQGKHSIVSSIIRCFTNSKWTHVAMVLKNPTFINDKLKGLYLWESGEESFPDSENNEYKYGIQIVDLKEKIKTYDGVIAIRKLTCNKENFETKLKLIHDSVHNKPYDVELWDFIMTKLGITFLDQGSFNYKLLNWFGYNPRKLDKMYCSSLVAYIYTELGLLNNDTRWTDVFPCYFSSSYSNLHLINASLGPEIFIHQ